MTQITVNPETLTQDQREAVAGFILTFPFKGQCIDEGCPQKSTPHICVDSTRMGAAADFANKAATMPAAITLADNPATGLPAPQDAFGDPVAIAFGGGVPLPVGATAAPYIAAAGQSAIAQGGTLATTANLPANVPLLPAQTGLVTVAPSASATPSANPVLVDKTGLPWDGRIHASTKTQTVDSCWKKKKGVDAGLVTQVEAELRQVMSASPNVQPAPLVAPVTTQIPGPVYSGANVPAQQMQQPVVPLNNQAPVVNGAIASTTVDPNIAKATWSALVTRISAAQAAGKLTIPELNTIGAKYGLPSFMSVSNRLDLIDAVAFDVDMLIQSR